MARSSYPVRVLPQRLVLIGLSTLTLISPNLAVLGHASAASTKMIGINGTYNVTSYVQDAQDLGVQWERIEQWDDAAVYDSVPSTLNRLSSHNIRMLPLVNNDYNTGWVTAADKTAWTNALVYTAKTYGAGGTYWQGKTDLGSPVVEVGNEAYGKWYPWPNKSYLYPGEYAKMLKQASIAVTAATNGRIKLIASAIISYEDTDDLTAAPTGTWKDWDVEMKKAVPDIASYLGGIASHPYGDIPAIGIGTRTDDNYSHQQLYAIHNRWPTLPVYLTEVGQKGPLVGFDKQSAAMNYYFDELKNNSWEAGIFWYNQKDYQVYNPNGDNGWALIDSNDLREPAWYTYQARAASFNTNPSDLNDDGKVNVLDLSLLLSRTHTSADLDALVAAYNK